MGRPPVTEKTWIVGPLRVRGPIAPVAGLPGSKGDQWTVLAVDSVTEETAEKAFSSATKAQAFIDSLVNGADPVDPLAEAAPEIVNPGTGSQGAFRPTTTATPATLTARHTRRQDGEAKTDPKNPAAAPFNLKSVSEALTDAGLDPFVEIAKVLKERVPIHRDGKPLVDDTTGEPVTVPLISGVDRAKILVELGQYVAPKLKAVEMKVEDKTKLTEEELDRRIAAFAAKQEAAQ